MAKKNQHYVSQFYLRYFSLNKKTTCLFNLKKELFIENAPIKDQCSKNFFYGRSDAFEDSLADLEQNVARTIKKLINSRKLNCIDDVEYRDLLSFTGFQYSKTDATRKRIDAIQNTLFNEVFLPRELHPKFIKSKEFRELGMTEEELYKTKFKIEDEAGFAQALIMGAYSSILISDLTPLLILNYTDNEFITSDSPVILHNLFFNKKMNGGRGFASKGIIIFYPLSPSILFFLFDPMIFTTSFKGNFLNLSNTKDIDNLNLFQMLYCNQNVYFRSKGMKLYVKNLNETIKNISKNEIFLDRRNVAGFTQEGISEKNINFNPKFSFLRTKNIGYNFGTRDKELVQIFNSISSPQIDKLNSKQ